MNENRMQTQTNWLDRGPGDLLLLTVWLNPKPPTCHQGILFFLHTIPVI